MSTQKSKGLGKGLGAIFTESTQGTDIKSMIEAIEKKTPQSSQTSISLDDIKPNPYQPRKHFDKEKLNELAQSIKEHGIFQPIIVKQSRQGYEIVAGERRSKAAKIAGLTEVPAIIVEFTDQQMMEIALLENIQREDLNAIEEAQAYQSMMQKLDLTQEELSMRIGKSRAHVANMVRLLKLPKEIQDYVLNEQLSMGQIRPLITVNEDKGIMIAKKAIHDKLSARDIEELVKREKKETIKKPKTVQDDSYKFIKIKEFLETRYKTKIKVNKKAITFSYEDEEELDKLLQLLGMTKEANEE